MRRIFPQDRIQLDAGIIFLFTYKVYSVCSFKRIARNLPNFNFGILSPEFALEAIVT